MNPFPRAFSALSRFPFLPFRPALATFRFVRVPRSARKISTALQNFPPARVFRLRTCNARAGRLSRGSPRPSEGAFPDGLWRKRKQKSRTSQVRDLRLSVLRSRKIFWKAEKLFAVVADGLNRAGFHRLSAEGGFVGVRGLLGHKCATGVAHFKKPFGRRGTQSATYALGVDIEFAGYVEFVFFVFVCHNVWEW